MYKNITLSFIILLLLLSYLLTLNKYLKNNSIIIILAFIISFFILNIMWYYYPNKMFDIDYYTKDDIKDFDNCLFVFNHDEKIFCSQAQDPMIMSNEIRKSGKKFNVVTNFKPFKYLPIVKPYNCLFKGNNTVKNMIEKINNGENGVIFLFSDSKSKGIFYILKNTNVPLVLINKKLGKEGKVEIIYKKIEDYNLNKDPEELMEKIKNFLFIENK